MPKPYQIKAAGEAKAELFIYGDIGENWWGDEIGAKAVVEQIAALEVDEIDVFINSYGGVVAEGIAIYNALRRHSATINVYIDGVAVSIASLIAMAGDTVTMSENALFMVHAPWGGAMGNAKELREYADVLDKYAEAMASSYVRKTGQSHDDIMALLTDGEDHYYTAAEAKEFGYVDEVAEEAMATAASGFKDSKFYPSLLSFEAKGLQAVAAKLKNSKPAAPVAAKPKPEKEEADMPDKDPATDPKAANADEIRAQVLAAETKRKGDIRAAYKPFITRDGVVALLDECIDNSDCTVEAANQKLLAKLGQGTESIQAGVTQDESEKKVDGMTKALLARVGAEKHDMANPYRGHTLSSMARACLEDAGASVANMTADELAPMALTRGVVRGAQTTSDFPVILENTMHKLVLTGFAAQPSTWDQFCKVGDVTDFREWNRMVPGLIGNLGDVNEAGEYLNKNIPDAEKNSVAAKRKGNIIAITPEVLVNDDIGYISDMATSLGRAGNRTIDLAVYALLQSNPALKDGTPLFHADHNNLAATHGSPTVDILDAMATKMGEQVAPGEDKVKLDIVPDVALVNRARKGAMNVLVNAQYDPDTANKLQKPNMVNGIVSKIVSTANIAAAPWYLFANPNIAPVIEVVFVNGQREPRLVVAEDFNTGGLRWRVELPFGVGAIDFRGAIKNNG